MEIIQDLINLSEKEKPHLLQTISLKTSAFQLFCKFFLMQVSPAAYNEAEAFIFSDAIRLLKTHVSRDFPGISALAAACYVSVPTFKRKFKTYFMTTPEKYYRQLQMEEAERLLQKPGMSVREVAGYFGYVSLQSFKAAFRKVRGYLPSWRKN
jgi:AraC-like DNA-binding protein